MSWFPPLELNGGFSPFLTAFKVHSSSRFPHFQHLECFCLLGIMVLIFVLSQPQCSFWVGWCTFLCQPNPFRPFTTDFEVQLLSFPYWFWVCSWSFWLKYQTLGMKRFQRCYLDEASTWQSKLSWSCLPKIIAELWSICCLCKGCE